MNQILCISIILMSCSTVPDSHSITITSSSGSVVQNGSSVTLTCTIELDPAVRESELPLLLVDALLLKDGADDPMALTVLTLTGTTFSYTTLIDTFSDNNVGRYSCRATVRPRASSIFLTGMSQLESNPIVIVIGK